MSRRSNDNKASAGTLVAIFVALASFTFVAWLPIRKGSSLCQLVGGLGIAGGLASVIWFVPAHEHPPDGLQLLAGASALAYVSALLIRLAGAVVPKAEPGLVRGFLPAFQTRSNEVILFQSDAQFLGVKSVRAFGGISRRIGFGLRGGIGLSVPISTMSVIDEGELIVTSERIVMAGGIRTTTFKASRVLDAGVDGNRVVIRPSNGRSAVVEVREPGAAAGAIRSAVQLAR